MLQIRNLCLIIDFYLNLQTAVLKGEREYPNVIGDADILGRRVFLQGVPQRMIDVLATRNDAPTDKLVHFAQQLWIICVGVFHPRLQMSGSRQVAAASDWSPHVAALREDPPTTRRPWARPDLRLREFIHVCMKISVIIVSQQAISLPTVLHTFVMRLIVSTGQVTSPRNARMKPQHVPFHIAREDAGAQLPLAL